MNAHRLNHHDIQAVKAFENRARQKARARRLACRLALLVSALAALFIVGLSGGPPRAKWVNAQRGIERDPLGYIERTAHEIAAGIAHPFPKERADPRAWTERNVEKVA